MERNRGAVRRAFRWLGIEPNFRAIMVLLAICSAIGTAAGFAFIRVAPLLSPTWSSSEYGEGYRRGRSEAELEFGLRAAEKSVEALRLRQEIDEKIRNMSDEERKAALKKWIRD